MKRMLYVTGLLLCTSLGGYAQEGNLIDVKVVNEEVKKQGSEVSLRMTLDLTGLRVVIRRACACIRQWSLPTARTKPCSPP